MTAAFTDAPYSDQDVAAQPAEVRDGEVRRGVEQDLKPLDAPA